MKAAWLGVIPGAFVLIWATGFVSAKLAMPHASPFAFLCIRYAASMVCLLWWIGWARPAWPQDLAQWRHLAITGVLMHGGYLGGVWAAVKLGMGAGLAALIVSLQPLITAAWLSARGTGVDRKQWAGLVLGLLGLVLVLSNKLGSIEVSTGSVLWIVLALCSITIGTLYQKAYVKSCDFRTASAVQLSAALAVSLPLALSEGPQITWHPDTVLALVWAVLGLTLGASSLMYVMIQRGAVTRVTSLLYLVPPTTAIMAWLMFGEPVTSWMIAGMLITAYAVWLAMPKHLHPPPPAQA